MDLQLLPYHFPYRIPLQGKRAGAASTSHRPPTESQILARPFSNSVFPTQPTAAPVVNSRTRLPIPPVQACQRSNTYLQFQYPSVQSSTTKSGTRYTILKPATTVVQKHIHPEKYFRNIHATRYSKDILDRKMIFLVRNTLGLTNCYHYTTLFLRYKVHFD